MRMRFSVSGTVYEFEPDPERLMGDELLLIEDQMGGDLQAWGARLTAGRFGVRDILLITFLAARRLGETRPWAEFITTVAPLTFQTVDDEPPAPPVAVVSSLETRIAEPATA